MLAACGSAGPMKAADPTPTPASIDLTGWTTQVHGVGPHAEIKNGSLELTLPWSTHVTGSDLNDMGVKLVAPCQLSGDFDIRIHYKLITWPMTSEAWVGIGAGDSEVARVSFRNGSDNNYATYFAGTTTRVGTSDMTGSVRLARAGTTISGYYENANGGWTLISSVTTSADPTTYAIQALTDAGFGQREVVAAVDSVSVNGTKVNCS